MAPALLLPLPPPLLPLPLPLGSPKHLAPCTLQEEMMRRLAGGANSGRASTAEKTLEKLKAEGTYVEKPFVPKKR